MIQEDKILVLKDLCARQMYGVKCKVIYSFDNETTNGRFDNETTNGRDVWGEDDDTIKLVNSEFGEVFVSFLGEWIDIENVKPYLRSMDDMTEDEKKEYYSILYNAVSIPGRETDFYNSHHFDYRGLIEKGLAIRVNKDNNPYKD